MWCRSLFPIPRFGITTSNPVEIFFSALRNCRHYPALDLLLHLETYIVILTTGSLRDVLLIYQKMNVLVDFTKKSLFLVDMPSNSLPPSEEIQKIIVQIFKPLNI